ncbi:acyltransferase [Methylobacterium variabile]|jgi:acetyltransferase-like isoleucine patch superfamily enzyme|uniref:acyltransferase n=1 Tax=Methylobacterium variabile TaxID=298794 RepID=UPI000A558B17|nr:acyltransferase [Methylobacterium variabile]
MSVAVVEEHPGYNEIDISRVLIEAGNGLIEILGRNNKIYIGDTDICAHIHLRVNGSNSAYIGDYCVLNGVNIQLVAPGSLRIGHRTGFNGHSHIHMHESARIEIGEDCLIAENTNLSTSHVHKILDLATGERLNPPGDVVLEDHVWSAGSVSLWGGAHVGRDSIIGRGSFVSKQRFPPNSLIVGAPARVVREGVTWEH